MNPPPSVSFSTEDLLAGPIGDDISVGSSIDVEILTDGSASIFSAEAVVSLSSRMNMDSTDILLGDLGEPDYQQIQHSQSTMSDAADKRSSCSPQPHEDVEAGESSESSQTRDASDQARDQAAAMAWREWDVPLGRAQEVREFVGNIRFRGIVEQHRPAYLQAGRKADKTAISMTVHSIITANGGRFMDKKKRKKGAAKGENGEWYEIPHEKALAKISQALRNGTRPVRKLMEHQHPPCMAVSPVPPLKATLAKASSSSKPADAPLATRLQREKSSLSGMCISFPSIQHPPHHRQEASQTSVLTHDDDPSFWRTNTSDDRQQQEDPDEEMLEFINSL